MSNSASASAGRCPALDGLGGDCFENAMMCESFFATLECELTDRSTFRLQAEAKLEIFDFIEVWYNPHRRHSSIGYLITDQLRKQNASHSLISKATTRPRTRVNPTATAGPLLSRWSKVSGKKHCRYILHFEPFFCLASKKPQ